MTDKILLPSAWDKLTADDKELAKELTQSILRGEASLQLLLQLLSGEEIDDEFKTTATTISNHEFDFEITTVDNQKVSSPQLMLASLTAPPKLQVSPGVFTALKSKCDNVCKNSPQAEVCKKCRKLFP
ncbi:MAG: hypothetical protein ACKO3K_02915 [Cuspidothrix sp.]